MAWIETASESFVARHDSAAAADAEAVLGSLEAARVDLASLSLSVPGDLTVVLHAGLPGLLAAAPLLGVEWRATAPAARRYVIGWAGREELHMLTPTRALERAAGTPESREMVAAGPACLLARRAIVASNRELAPVMPALRLRRQLRWAWLVEGAARYLGGQTAHARPAIVRRLREGPPPGFPPSLRDASLLGGTVIDLLAREQGIDAAARFACRLDPRGPRSALHRAFGGRPLDQTEAAWRSHLARLGSAGESAETRAPARRRR